MLVLTRKRFETIVIGDGLEAIEVTVTYLGADRVKLGINAPKTTLIRRKEIIERAEERATKNGQQ